MTRMMLIGLALLIACRGRGTVPAARDAPAHATKASVDGAPFARVLADAAAGPVLLVAETDALVARTASGAAVRTLVDGAVNRAHYDPSTRVLWFVRDARLEALDLAAAPAAPIAVVDDMPDLGFNLGIDPARPMCDACVSLQYDPPAVGVTTEAHASGGQFEGDAWRQFERDRAIAARARPRLAPRAAAFLAGLDDRLAPLPADLELDAKTWPLPASARSKDDCPDCVRTDEVGCADCGRGFVLGTLGWVLVVSDRKCSCAEDACWATCVLYDPARDQYAAASKPGAWRPDVMPERACHPTFDRAGTAYILDQQHVCTQRECTRVSGRILGWIEPGATTASLRDDSGAWPRCDAP